MNKPFAQCSLADLAHEVHLAARLASSSALNADAAARIIPCLLDHKHTEEVLQRHPGVREQDGQRLVCSAATDSKQAWCSMLRDLFITASASVSDDAIHLVYLVVAKCEKRGQARVAQSASKAASLSDAVMVAISGGRHASAAGAETARFTVSPSTPQSLPFGRWSLHVFAALEQLQGARVFLRLSDTQGAALARSQTGTARREGLLLRLRVPIYKMAMGHRQRLSVMGCGGTGKVVLLMSQGGGGAKDKAYHQLMDCIVRRVAAGRIAATPWAMHAAAESLRARGECAAAAVLLERAVRRGHLPSSADLADMLIGGRAGVAKDPERALVLAEEGERLGCHHCQGVMAWCYFIGMRGKMRPLAFKLATRSAAKGSKYGQRVLGECYMVSICELGIDDDYAAGFAQFRLAAAQNYDPAQHWLGILYSNGTGVAQDKAEGLRWSMLAAAQGHDDAQFDVGECYERGEVVAANEAEAIRWYRRAAASGHYQAAERLKELGA